MTPLCTTPMAKDTWVEVGPGRHCDKPSSSRKTADDSHLSFSTKTYQEAQERGDPANPSVYATFIGIQQVHAMHAVRKMQSFGGGVYGEALLAGSGR